MIVRFLIPLVLCLLQLIHSFVLPIPSTTTRSSRSVAVPLQSALSHTAEYTVLKAEAATDEWELDCYSRPVAVNGKKLWEVLITDSAGSFRFRQELPSNQVNSKTVRQVVDDLMEVAETKPNTIRFFRGAMFNMINIALSELPVTSKPSRCTFALASWLEELHRDTYPGMEGYNPAMASSMTAPSFLDVRTPIKLPDALRGEKYAFVALPIQEFLPGGGVAADNIGVGRLCQLPAFVTTGTTANGGGGTVVGADTFVQGVVILSSRAAALASWLAGTEVVALQADLRKRVLTMETDIDNQYLMAKLNDQQRAEAAAFEEGKDMLQGLHFVSVQKTEDDDPEGFWLLRELPSGI
jgi:RNA-binding protein Tab2/Atab2